MAPQFSGFTQQGLDFLRDVRSQNSKEWFNEHRHIYDEQLLTPFKLLVEQLSAYMLVIDEQFDTKSTIGVTLSRIYRDTRFSSDKSIYRDKIWLRFKRPSKNWLEAPTYFFELSPDQFRYGLGYYSAPKPTMDLFRQAILANPKEFLNIVKCCKQPFELVGELYKRKLIKEQAESLATWYNRKSFAVMVSNDQIEDVFSEKFANTLADDFEQLAPLYHFLMKIELQKRASGS